MNVLKIIFATLFILLIYLTRDIIFTFGIVFLIFSVGFVYLFFESSNLAVESISNVLSGGGSFPLVKEGAKLIYPLSVALIVICLEEKRLWMPRLDPNCF